MPLLFDSLFSSVAFGHLIVDMLNGSRPVLLTYLGLTRAQIGVISTVYVWGASLMQPVFGWLGDRVGLRWLATGGVLWMVVFYSLALWLPLPLALVCLVAASLGSAAFHPVGVTQATIQGDQHMGGRETTATSFFFTFGQLGLFFGPILSGLLLHRFGVPGMFILPVVALPIGVNIAWQLRSRRQGPRRARPASQATGHAHVRVGAAFIVALALAAALQSWAQQNMINFIPKYLSDLGRPASVYGNIAGLFMGGSALGNIIGGTLADRYGKQRVATIALVLASVPLYLISRIGWSAWLYLLVPLAGALTGAIHSIVVVIAQRVIPGGMALASGLTLGFIFSAGALGMLLTGTLAERWGFEPVFQMTAGLVLVAAALMVTLRGPTALSSRTEASLTR